MTARVVVGSQAARAFVPFELKSIPKSFPGKRWDPVGKCWILPVSMVDALANALRAAGVTVFVTCPDGTPWKSGATGRGHRATPGDDWADGLFAAVGPDRVDLVFRALSKTLHPDAAAGDTVLMQQLNAARERAAFRRRSAS